MAGDVRELALTVNGRGVHEHVDDRLLLSDFLRHSLGLRGTHVGCEHGVCGACTVQLDGRAVRSCLMLAAQAEGCHVETVESLAEPEGPLSALQDAFRRHHALQCGFCTPGILMSAAELLAARRHADAARDRGAALGPPLPLHRLRADRGRHRRGRGERGVNLGEHLLACAERHPEALAIVDGEQRATYAELLERARAAAGGLAGARRRPGDRVAAALKNRIETAVLYWASQWLGAVFVPLNWRLRPDELTYCVGDCGAKVLAIEGASAEAAEAVPGTPLIAIADAPAGEPLARGDGPGGALGRRRARAGADALHLGHDRAPEGRAALAPRRARRGARAARAARAPPRRPHARRDAALPHDGHALPARRERLRRRLLQPAGVPRRRRARRRGARAADLAVPRADALPRHGRRAARAPARRLERARAGLRRRAHDRRARRALRRGVRAGGVREPLRLDRDLHVHDPRRPARQAGLCRAARR